MPQVEGCKHELEITVPVAEVKAETERVLATLQAKVRLPGFRPGKAPATLVRSRFQQEIRQDVIESLVPKHFKRAVERDNLEVVGRPDITDVHFHEGEPLRFKAEFEVAPAVELGDYRGLLVTYNEPRITDANVDARLEELQNQKADFVNVDPRPIEDGDFTAVSLHSLGGVEEPIAQDEIILHVGDQGTLKAFSENLRGMSPDEEKEFEVAYPEDYDRPKLAGRTVRFRCRVKSIRRKELPEVNDEFARDLGDYQNLGELRDALRKNLFAQREYEAQQRAKQQLIEKLVDAHDFPVPQAYVERQMERNVEQHLRTLTSQGLDPGQIKLDWQKVRETQEPRARRDVKATLLLDRIADREAIDATQDEVDREVQRMARQSREAVAVTRAKLQKDGAIGRIAAHIRTEKTLSFLFEQARKEAGELT